ncbi:Fe-S cluster assembly ATPase SufC [Candidatus Woesearchaeota archaeon]|nr:Fe-S cluster assembly ATPase SufC [Candidatus Woesearchaeota archaeon]
MNQTLKIKDLSVSINNKLILDKINLEVKSGEVCALMGPNGSGKSTLANVIMGNPKYKIENGSILINNESITNLKVNEKAKKGIFLSFQYPSEVSGVTISNFLRTALNTLKDTNISVMEFQKILKEKIELLEIKDGLTKRYLNEGFSGGEKKKFEILQMAVLQPKFALLDETDSGLDIDSLKIVTNGINKIKESNNTGFLIITHHQKILDYIKPDKIYIIVGGKIIKQGDSSLSTKLEELGYKWLKEEN